MNRLREQRERSRLTVHEVSKITGISQSALTKYENGDLKLSDERAKTLAKLYKVETHELFLKLEAQTNDEERQDNAEHTTANQSEG